MGDASRAVLITGCSTGIGRATALRLAASGWPVWATARDPSSIADLTDAGCRTLPLDVTDEASMADAVATVEAEHGAVGVLVNNAGYGQEGAVEDVPIPAVRRQFETNLFGPLRLVQLCAPAMRGQRWGRIVNVSSMGGKVTLPGGGIYHASKFALESVSDALRYELAGFGIRVVVVEPGPIRTDFGKTAVRAIADAAPEDGPYARFNRSLSATVHSAYEGRLAVFAARPDAVARVIEKAIASGRPRSRYPVTLVARLLMATRAVAPDRLWDTMMRTTFPRPR